MGTRRAELRFTAVPKKKQGMGMGMTMDGWMDRAFLLCIRKTSYSYSSRLARAALPVSMETAAGQTSCCRRPAGGPGSS
jgi:hypothetical protein